MSNAIRTICELVTVLALGASVYKGCSYLTNLGQMTTETQKMEKRYNQFDRDYPNMWEITSTGRLTEQQREDCYRYRSDIIQSRKRLDTLFEAYEK